MYLRVCVCKCLCAGVRVWLINSSDNAGQGTTSEAPSCGWCGLSLSLSLSDYGFLKCRPRNNWRSSKLRRLRRRRRMRLLLLRYQNRHPKSWEVFSCPFVVYVASHSPYPPLSSLAHTTVSVSVLDIMPDSSCAMTRVSHHMTRVCLCVCLHHRRLCL